MNKALLAAIVSIVGLTLISQVRADASLYQQQVKIAQNYASALQQKHFNQYSLNDDLSQKIFNYYLRIVDPAKMFFTQNDIEEFSVYKNDFDEVASAQWMSPVYNIYVKKLQRNFQKNAYYLSLIDKGIGLINLNEKSVFDVNRKDAAWENDKDLLKDLWLKQLKFEILNMKALGKTNDEIQTLLNKKYTVNSKKLNQEIQSQEREKNAFENYLMAMSSVYGPHSQYFSPVTSEDFAMSMNLKLKGIGAQLTTKDGQVEIVKLLPGGPAHKSGLISAGDKIVKVGDSSADMFDISGWELQDVVKKIRGEKGSTVFLGVISKITGKKNIISLMRDEIKLEDQAAKGEVLDVQKNGKEYKVGVVTIPTFYRDFNATDPFGCNFRSVTCDVKDILMDFNQQNVDGVIVDLRDNGGGALIEAINLSSLFLDHGPIVHIGNRAASIPQNDSLPGMFYSGPLMVLTNRQSASASEIFAGAVKDYGRGILLGGKTFGKGTVQAVEPIYPAGQIKYTNAMFYRPNGSSTQNLGVAPDIIFPSMFDESEFGESALDNALAWHKHEGVGYQQGTDQEFLSVITRLAKSHQERIQSNPDFSYIKDFSQFQSDLRKQNLVSLQQSEFIVRQNKVDEQLLDMKNKRRAAKQLSPIAKLSEISDEDFKDLHKGILLEGVNIMADYLDLTGSGLMVKMR